MFYSKFVCDSKIKGGDGKQCKWDVRGFVFNWLGKFYFFREESLRNFLSLTEIRLLRELTSFYAV